MGNSKYKASVDILSLIINDQENDVDNFNVEIPSTKLNTISLSFTTK